MVTLCCTHRSGHGIVCPILRAGNKPITSLLVIGLLPATNVKGTKRISHGAANNRLTIGRYGSLQKPESYLKFNIKGVECSDESCKKVKEVGQRLL